MPPNSPTAISAPAPGAASSASASSADAPVRNVAGKGGVAIGEFAVVLIGVAIL